MCNERDYKRSKKHYKSLFYSMKVQCKKVFALFLFHVTTLLFLAYVHPQYLKKGSFEMSIYRHSKTSLIIFNKL